MQYNRHIVKQIFAGVLMLMLVVLSACNKFLDMPPKDRAPQSELFKDEQGFKDALVGVYLAMDKPQFKGFFGLYTNNLSMGMLSTLAYQYDNAATANPGTNGTFFTNVVYYMYTDGQVEQEINGIWSGMYNNIANLNNILVEIDGKKAVFTGDNFNRIKGEALAMRALFHFDLLRMFGQPPATGAGEKAIPYVTQFSIKPTRFVTLTAALDSCIMDLTAAKDLLALTDTSAVLGGTHDAFKSYTQNHVNYWAVQGLLARVYLYKGDNANAVMLIEQRWHIFLARCKWNDACRDDDI